jgi:IS5 family transposase
MRQVQPKQLQLGEIDIASIQLDINSRDDIPQLLRGLQYLYEDNSLREQVFAILEKLTDGINCRLGRPGMNLWKILVLGTLRLNLNCDYDRLQELANNHKTIRQMLGHGITDEDRYYGLQTLKDNVALFTLDHLNDINQIVVSAGHQFCKVGGELMGRCDSFVVETDVHFPTDINLLYDAVRKVITLSADLADGQGLTLWRQSHFNVRQFKICYRAAQKIKHSTSKDEEKKAKRHEEVVEAHRVYLEKAEHFLERAELTLLVIDAGGCGASAKLFEEIQRFMAHAKRQISQIERRVINGEVIPHDEKVFSIFQEHTEWISKGKAGVPVELGLRVCVLEDQFGFILHHCVMQKQTDDKIAVTMVSETQERFTGLRGCSFDKGFHSPANQVELREQLDLVVLPKKGRRNKVELARESQADFIAARRNHSGVESAINALEVHGLDICLDHGIDRFERYVALAVVARNLQKLGAMLQKEAQAKEMRRRKKRKLAA